MKTIFIFFIISFFFCLQTIAQSTVDKVNNTATQMNNGSEAVNNTSQAINNTATSVSTMGKTIGGIFKSKKKDSAKLKQETTPAMPAATATQSNAGNIVLNISGVDYQNLKTLEDALKNVSGAQVLNVKFISTLSALNVSYTGKANELWDAMPANISKMYSLTNLDDNNISLQFNK